MFVYVRYARHSPETKTNVSLGYMILNAAAIAAMNTWVAPPPLQAQMVQVSWIAILLLVYSMVAPASPAQDARRVARRGVHWIRSASGWRICAACRCRRRFRRSCSSGPTMCAPCWRPFRRAFFATSGQKLRKARELGSYELVKLLGHGGMGEVWEAQHRLLARRAAVKLVRPEVLGAASDAEAKVVLKRFEREAQATAALSSPHTIQLFDFGSHRPGHLLLRDGTARRARSRIAGARVRPAAGRARGLSAAAGLPLARRRARARPRPSRHQTRQHLRLPDGARVRLREGAGFRSGEAEQRRTRRNGCRR